MDAWCPRHPHVRLTWIAVLGPRCLTCSTERIEAALRAMYGRSE